MAEGGFAFVTPAVLALTAVAGFLTAVGPFAALPTGTFGFTLGALAGAPVTAFLAPSGCDPVTGFGVGFLTELPAPFFCVFAVVVNVFDADDGAEYMLGLVTDDLPATELPLKPSGF